MKVPGFKFKPKPVKPKKRVNRHGPVPLVGGNRMNFFPGDCLRSLPKLNKRLSELKVKRVTKSFALREGAKLWIRQKLLDAKKALSGEYHAKKRTEF